MSIYTGRGDEGMTDLWNMDRVPKTSPRVEAYGTVDELNSLLGTAVPTGYEDVDEQLRAVQNHLFVVQADLANPDSSPGEDEGEGITACVRPEHVDRIEEWIDAHQEDLEPTTAFILPGGSEHGSRLHHARSVCRRAERRTVELAESEDVNDHVLEYLNRLSDGLFVFARVVNAREGVEEENPTY
ncbi:ATP:cob(I)alamin adenosyltransferase [Halobacteriales archaeon QS_8_69_26]|nr:MAG: ATP:cob(I)alamin adenosyltransferase [Halobacteriales archaeon QS_8_69_26]